MLDRWGQVVFPGVPEAMRSSIVPIEISDVAHWFYTESTQEEWDWENDFPSLAPPFQYTWYEYKLPRFSNSGGSLIDMTGPHKIRHGVFVWAIRVDDEEKCNDLAVHPAAAMMLSIGIKRGLISNDQIENVLSKPLPGTVRWLLAWRLWISVDDDPPTPWASMYDYVSGDGRPYISKRFLINEGFTSPDELTIVNASPFLPVGFAISLLHCRNVEVRDLRPPLTITKKRAAQPGWRGVRYRTLEIEPIKRILRTEGQSSKKGLRISLHLCRGHFKDYREGRGLFGRYHGVYWWEPHVRGDARVGMVVKDYRMHMQKSPEGA